jgi:hypothetical protein
MQALNTLLVIMAFAAIAAHEIPKMLKGKLYRELAVFSVVLGLGFAVALMHALGVRVPNPFKAMDALVSWAKQSIRRLR